MVRATRTAYMAVLLAVVGSSVLAQTNEIVFVNRTGATIYFLYASDSSADTWGEDLLGRTVLADNEVFGARLRSEASRYDIRAVDANDNEYVIWGWEPTRERRVVLTRDALVGSGVSAADSSVLSWITIVNDTRYNIVEIHIVPADGHGWDEGDQVLEEDETVLFGEEYRVEVDAERYDTLVYDIMLVDEDGDRYIKRDIDLEVTTQVVYALEDLDWQ